MLNKLKNNKTLKKIIEWSGIILSSAYVFCILSFSGVSGLEKITYIPMIMLCISAALVFVLYKENIKFDFRLIIIVSFLIVMFISTCLGTRNFRKILTILLLVISTIVLFINYSIVKNNVVILYSILIPIFMFALYFFYIYRQEIIHLNFDIRIGTKFGNVNESSINMAYGAIIALLLSIYKKQYWLYPVFAVLSFLCLFSQSKKTLIVIFICALIIILYKVRKKPLLILIVALVFIGIPIIFLSIPELYPFAKRFVSMFQSLNNVDVSGSTSIRLMFFNSALYHGFHNFLFGYGNEGFRTLTPFATYSHANLSEIVCNFGLLGFISFYFLYPFFLNIEGKDKEIKMAFILSFLTIYSIYSFTVVYFDEKMYYVLIALCLCFSEKIEFGTARAILGLKPIIETRKGEVNI